MEALPNELWEKIIPTEVHDRTSSHLVCRIWFDLAINKIKHKYKDFLNHKKQFKMTLDEISLIEYSLFEKQIDEPRYIGPGDAIHDVKINCDLLKYESVRQYKNKATYTQYINENYIIDYPFNSMPIIGSSDGIAINTIYYTFISRNDLGLRFMEQDIINRDAKIIQHGPYYKFDINSGKYGIDLNGPPKNCTIKISKTTVNYTVDYTINFTESAIEYTTCMCYVFKN